MRTASLFAHSEACPHWPQRPADSGHGLPRTTARAVRAHVALWIERVRQRDALAGLNDHQLRDIGITRAEAARECEKPFWR